VKAAVRALLAALAIASVSPVAAYAQGSVTKTATQDGMTVTLTADPLSAGSGTVVRFVGRAHTEQATGALVYGLTYGDGTSSRPVAVPQYCLAGAGRPASGTWRFTHRYAKPGRYQVRFGVSVNCGGEHASVQLTLDIRA
jgi:hypothetical protein